MQVCCTLPGFPPLTSEPWRGIFDLEIRHARSGSGRLGAEWNSAHTRGLGLQDAFSLGPQKSAPTPSFLSPTHQHHVSIIARHTKRPGEMSRLIVKNLPAYLSDARLREHFAQKGLVTDVKLVTRPDGTSRRFGFVGYRSEAEAQEALRYFNRTFIDTSRIQVDVAKKIGDESAAHVAHAQRKGVSGGVSQDRSGIAEASTSASKSPADRPGSAGKPDRGAGKPKPSAGKGVSFEEFMAVMAPKKKRKTWQNEEDDPEANLRVSASDKIDDAQKEKKKRKKDRSAADVPAANESSTGLADGEGAAKSDDVDKEVPDPVANDEALTDLDYMHQRMKRNVGVNREEGREEPEKQFEQSDSEDDEGSASEDESADESEDEATRLRLDKERLALEEKSRKDQEAVDTIMESARLFIRNLPFSATEDDIESHFAVYGPVKQVHITLDRSTKASKGMAYVSYDDPAHALAAFRAADGSTFQGRLLHLLPAVSLRPRPDGPVSLKQSRADDRKANADKDFNWSSLYMSADAVATSVADRLGVDKSDILNPSDESSGDSAAVRLALAETKVIRETKEFLEQEGVNVATFDQGAKARSETTILVKNIPYGTQPDTIREMFEKHGEVDRVLVPPAGTIALVDMVVASEARVAFKALAYRRIGNSLLYLEKAPDGVMVNRDRSSKDDVSASKPVSIPTQSANSAVAGGVGSEADAEAGATLFVKNLSFATTDAKLANLFGTLANFAFARVQTRIDSRDPSKRLSMGYGFVGYRSVEAAKTALLTLQGKDLEGHALALSFARRGQDSDDAPSSKTKASSTKLVVKNLPFETTKKDVRALFAAHGQLKSVRVPRKAASAAGAAGAGARGFAFVEFTSKREAEAAYESLRHAHFLGRHLVLQWDAEDAQGVEGIRAKVKESFDSAAAQSKNAGGNRARKEKLKLGQEDIAEASRKARAQRDDVDDE
ncbi:unnamed protein product [Parajaminaea phylloscopi]